MSRVAKVPVTIPAGVEVKLSGKLLSVKGPKGKLEFTIHPQVNVTHEGARMTVGVQSNTPTASALSGTTRALINNMVLGAHKGFEKKLNIIGVGYRAAVAGKNLNLTLGFSHAVVYPIPEGITIETPSQTDIVVRGADKQKVGQVAAEIRAYRGPEPYKGKGVRYTDEHVVRKEAKKK